MIDTYIKIIREYSYNTYKQMTRKASGELKYPFIVPGSDSYQNCLWDWDSWLSNIAVRQIMSDNNEADKDFILCEKGCILNFLFHMREDGKIPIVITPESADGWLNRNGNIHKPCLVQHAAFITKINNSDISWLVGYIDKLELFVNYYIYNCKHKYTGLYFWIDDLAIGVDNDPCTFYRPERSSASVFLNCIMYKELLALIYILELSGRDAGFYKDEAENLKKSVNKYLWDERNGFYYSADINLKEINSDDWLHSGAPRDWNSIIQKIDVWSGFLAMWAGITDSNRAKRMVFENMLDKKTFNSEYGVRSLSRLEQMYQLKKTGNPSCWLGPIWGISNWMCFKGLINYGFLDEAKILAKKTITLLGNDIEKNGLMHEYYHPETGEGMNNPGFQNWNLLVNNMIAWIEGRTTILEY